MMKKETIMRNLICLAATSSIAVALSSVFLHVDSLKNGDPVLR